LSIDQPFLDETGNGVAVAVHHDHVGIALDAHVREIDDIDMASGGLENACIIDAGLADFRPARMILGVVAVDDEDRRGLDRGALLRSPPTVGSTATRALTLSGRASSAL
jgi:hypothetical protein